MALPRAVQRQLDQAAELEKQLTGAVDSEPAPAEPVVQQTEPEPTPAPEPAPTPEEPKPEPTLATDWEQRYKTIQGKFNAEVPRLTAQVNELSTSLQAALSEIEKMKHASPPPAAEPLVTEKDKEEFGADLVALQERIARQVAAPLQATIDKLAEKLASYGEVVNTNAAQVASTAEERYFDKLAARVPEWEHINSDAKWLEWLEGRFPGVRQTRQQMLNAARAALDLEATVELFAAYKELTGTPKPSPSKELESQITPGKGRANNSAPVSQEKKMYTGAEYAALLDPRNLRKVGVQEAERLMSELDTALLEGRVRW